MCTYDVIVIGGGPAGMMASITAAQNKSKVLLIEKNEKLGKKLYLTGKGRCNITNASSIDNHINNIVRGKKFVYSSLNQFSPAETISFFNNLGLTTKIERGNRVFPMSDKSSDVIKYLKQKLDKLSVEIAYKTNIQDVICENEHYIVCTNNCKYTAYSVVICTGGLTYSGTGNTGDGYIFAKKFDHTIVETKPALIPFLLVESVKEIEGLTLKNVELSLKINNRLITKQFGEVLFTKNGISGPIVLTISSLVNRVNLKNAVFEFDLKPAFDNQILNEKIIRDISKYNNKSICNYLKTLLPSSLVPFFIKKYNFENKKLCEITKTERQRLITGLKRFDLNIKSLDNIEYGIITSGGVDLDEINPKTMESKLYKGLYFAGEVLDIDALTGGYNLQIAWSTGYVAGSNASKRRI